jgi:hypothetical protein
LNAEAEAEAEEEEDVVGVGVIMYSFFNIHEKSLNCFSA